MNKKRRRVDKKSRIKQASVSPRSKKRPLEKKPAALESTPDVELSATSSDEPKTQPPFVVGIGASAGGLEALRSLFSALNEPTNASFIVVQHMAPNYRSLLAELIGRESPLTVKEAEHDEKLMPNVVYVTPPNRDILLQKDTIKLEKPIKRIAPKPSVDRFFFSLGEEFEDRCGAIILSGTGTDGAQGILAVKSAGGFTIAQSPDSAKYDGMPNSAVQTGAIDLILSPQEIALRLRSIIEGVGKVSAADLDYPSQPFQAILEHVRRKKRVDFSQYKPNTLTRRIKRRMGTLQVPSMNDYFLHLKRNSREVDVLYRDLTISVTEFFRDAEYFRSLTKELTKYLKARKPSDTIRAWSAGCATGEEAYTMAIIIHEVVERLKIEDINIQIFSTDINELGMEIARKATYSPLSLKSVPTACVKKYFDRFDGKYRVKKFIRDCVVFARHDLTIDPPFLKMDLTCCRNVFIYFNPKIQEKIFKIFHYSLNPNGILFLGKSESLGTAKEFFEPVDGLAKIFRRTDKIPSSEVYFSSLPPKKATRSMIWPAQEKKETTETFSDLIHSLLPDSIIVDADFQVLEVLGNGRNFLEIKTGKVGKSIEELIVDSLKGKVLTLLHRAKRNGETAKGFNFVVAQNKKKSSLLDVMIYPLKRDDGLKFIISFSKIVNSKPFPKMAPAKEIQDLEQELTSTREHLQTVIEEQETANEELQALNEEMQSTNEELQSTNEELETSNEELQSTNEELTTLNEEMNVKTNEVMSLYSQLDTILGAIRNPILVADRNMNLMRYNEPAAKLFSIDKTMVDKSAYLTSELPEARAAFDLLHQCIRTGQSAPAKLELSGRSFIASVDPVINGKKDIVAAVLSLVDNTELYKNLELLQTSERKVKSVLENTLAPVCIRDTTGRFTYVNRKFSEFFKVAADKIIGKTSEEVFDREFAIRMRKLDSSVLGTLSPIRTQETYSINGHTYYYIEKRFALVDAQGAAEGICTMAFDITEQVEMNKKLHLFKQVVASSHEALLIFKEDDDGRDFRSTFVSKSAESVFGRSLAILESATLKDILNVLNPEAPDPALYEKLTSGSSRIIEWKIETSGVSKWYEMRATIYQPEEKQTRREIFLVFVDVTASRDNERILREKREEVLRAGRLSAMGEMAAGLAHEINTPLNIILAQVDLLFADHDFPPASKGALNKIATTVEDISSIIKSLKSMARIDTDQPLEKVQLGRFIKEMLDTFQLTLRHRGIRLILDIPSGDFEYMCRPTHLGQILLNLVNNAADAVQKLESKWIKIELIPATDIYVLRVIDSGDGIPAQHLAKIMTPFFTTKKTGTGLGLSLSTAIVQQYGGKLLVDSSCKHTCFEVQLPLAPQQKTKEGVYGDRQT